MNDLCSDMNVCARHMCLYATLARSRVSRTYTRSRAHVLDIFVIGARIYAVHRLRLQICRKANL